MKNVCTFFLSLFLLMSNAFCSEFLPFEEFEKKFQLKDTTTEQRHPETMQLSQVMHENVSQGLLQLLSVDRSVLTGFDAFIPSIRTLAPQIAARLKKNGRVFLVGSGTSGRVGIDIAAKCCQTFKMTCIHGVIAGGDSAIIRAKEGFEDSEEDGRKALQSFNIDSNDCVILISASGSASFNVGCGHYASDQGALVLYFYNSQSIPSRTQDLFDRVQNPVMPLCVDIGPQAISGSTRLQSATLAEASLGALLASALYLSQDEDELAFQYPKKLFLNMTEGLQRVKEMIPHIEKFVMREKEIFAAPDSNFFKVKDQSNQGYVTLISGKACIREVLVDATEMSPTFSINPMRRNNEAHKKRAEFQAYLMEEGSNQEAWKILLGRESREVDVEDFILSYHEGKANRPLGKGNLVIGVATCEDSLKITTALQEAKSQGAATGLILLSYSKTENVADMELVIENIPYDAMGLTQTIMLKQVLNLLSNGSMVLMNKVHGNQMIDVRASNYKLINRCMRLIKEIWSEYRQDETVTDKELYHAIVQINAIKKIYEEKGIYTPSVVKITLAMLALKKSSDHFQTIIEFLNEKQERIDWIGV